MASWQTLTPLLLSALWGSGLLSVSSKLGKQPDIDLCRGTSTLLNVFAKKAQVG